MDTRPFVNVFFLLSWWRSPRSPVLSLGCCVWSEGPCQQVWWALPLHVLLDVESCSRFGDFGPKGLPGKALVSVEEIIYSHAVGINSDNSAIRQWSGLQEHRKRLAELRATLRQEVARDIRISLHRDIRRELTAKMRMVKGEQLNRLLAGYFDRCSLVFCFGCV